MKWNGTISHTVTGRKCQKWVSDIPHRHRYHLDSKYPEGSQAAAKSYCRDPDGDGAPWCYTVDPAKRWEYCGIPQCASEQFSTHDAQREKMTLMLNANSKCPDQTKISAF